MMSGIRQLCALAVFSGFVLCITPEGSVKRLTAICCTLAMLLCLTGSLRDFSLDDYSLELAKYRELEQELSQSGDEARDKLNRRVIEQECEAYITDKAAELGLRIDDLRVTARWSMDGVWIPYRVELRATGEAGRRERLAGLLEAELGIPRKRQDWREDEN